MALQLIMSRQAISGYDLLQVQFSRTSKLIVIFTWPCGFGATVVHAEISIYDCAGQAISHFQDTISTPSFDFVQGSRLAIALPLGVRVWDMLTGQLLGSTAALATSSGPTSSGKRAFVAANKTGCKLAFLNAHSPALHLYNALTLEALACLQPAGSMEYQAIEGATGGLVWGSSGRSWLLLQRPAADPWSAQSLVIFKVAPGSTWLTLVLQRDATFQCNPACLSPDLSCVCTHETIFKAAQLTINVHNLHSGALVLAHKVKLPGVPTSKCSVVWWASCGSRLVVTTSVQGLGGSSSFEHVTLLQL